MLSFFNKGLRDIHRLRTTVVAMLRSELDGIIINSM